MRWMIVLMMLIVPQLAHANDIVERFETDFEQTHDRGFHLGVHAGVLYGYTRVVPEYENQSSATSSMQAGLALDLGGYLTDRLIVHVSHWSSLNTSRGVLSQGLGLSYYFHEHGGWFVSSAVGMATLFDTAPDIEVMDQWAMAARVSFGTGWWIGPHQSLQVALTASGHHVDIDGDGIVFAGAFGGIMASFAWK